MGIEYIEDKRIFHIQGENVSYIIKADEYDNLLHLYFGKKIRQINANAIDTTKAKSWSPTPDPLNPHYALDSALMEYPAFGYVDFRSPAIHLEQENGSTILDLKYHSYEIFKGKKMLEGLPATYATSEEAETLEITLMDKIIKLAVILSYSVFNQRNVITRSVKVVNQGKQTIKLLNVQSCCLDFKDSNFELLQLSGAWARERQIVKRPLAPGKQSIESVSGISSHAQNPFLALLSPGTTEIAGEAYGFSFVYSGNFLGEASVSEHNRTRLLMGIHPLNFSWQLDPSKTFQTPEVVMVYSSKGLGGMSHEYHNLYRENLFRGTWKEKERPILINNWEATYFDFTNESIEKLAQRASEAGIELFVLDDGWFGQRNADNSSLGDWFVNETKLVGGLKQLAETIRGKNMTFGLWVEPEMVSPDSELYRKHSDWCLHVNDRAPTQVRNQLVLDFSRKEVCDYIIDTMSQIFSNAPISYVKWDMNRPLTNVLSSNLPNHRQMETSHRYMLGVYHVMETLVTRHKEILFEGCSGGGGRTDPGILYYSPQVWISDDTDAIERLKIQYGASLVYPLVAMGSHVSSVPNHQCERVTSLETRGDVAMSGNLGYELDITDYTQEQIDTIKGQVDFYKANKRLIQFGDFYRLKNPFEGNSAAWIFVSKNKTEAILFYINVLGMPNPFDQHIQCRGLNPDFNYAIEGLEGIFGGDELMHVGLTLPTLNDFESVRYKLKKV